MLDPRWRKVVRDAWLHRARTMLVVLAIATGVAGAGTILNAWALVQRATQEGYAASDPAAATLHTDSVDDALLRRVRTVPGVRDAQARRTVMARVQAQGAWLNAMLFATHDFSSVRIGRLRPEAGAWPPADGAIVVERSSVELAGSGVGEAMRVSIQGSEPRALAVTGIARDVGLAPGWMEHVVYAFVTPATLELLGVPAALDEVRFVVADTRASQDDVRRIAWAVKAAIEATGRRVSDVDVPVPGEHVHAAQMDSLLYTQGAFGVLALVVCAFLVVNLMAAMLAGQVREIGVMKTLGAGREQLSRMYLAFAFAVGLLAASIAVPIALVVGQRYAALKAELLNFPIEGHTIPWWAIAVQVVVAAVLPVVAAAFPVARGCRIPVSEALRDVGIDRDAGMPPGRPLARVHGLSSPSLLALRNAFRRRQRTMLTLLALASGGAVYLGARNLRASVIGSLDLLFGSQRYDFVLRLAEPQLPDSVEAAVAAVPGVSGVESWAGVRASRVHDDGAVGNAFPVAGPPADTRMLEPRLVSGRWIGPGDSAATIVVNRTLLRREPAMAPGRTVALTIGGRTSPWTVIGAVDAGPAPSAFATREAIARATGSARTSSLTVASSIRGVASQVDLIQRVRSELDRRGMAVSNSQLLQENRRVTEDHLLMVVQFLGVMGWVMILVGGMGLASTMSLAVLERTREIGVMRAIGARHAAILRMIQVEGLVIALLGWLVAIPLSIPMSVALGEAFSRVMLRVPLSIVPEGAGVVRWLALVVAVSVLACAWPALRAARITVARALAYE